MPACYRSARYSTVLLVLFLFLFAAHVSHAATITVTGGGDSGTDDTVCTLREAIAAANSDSAVGGCAAGSGMDLIEFDTNGYFSVPRMIVLSLGSLTINSNLTISGPGAASLAISGNDSFRIFEISTGVTATIEGLTIRNGRPAGFFVQGGGIQNRGTLTILNSTVTDNIAPDAGGLGGQGGGIANLSGDLTVENSTISNNVAASGGGISNSGGAVMILNSTISGNAAYESNGGGVDSSGGSPSLIMVNSTVSGNSAVSHAGGVFCGGASSITGSTISGNTAPLGAGIAVNVFGGLIMTNSTVSANAAGLSGGGILTAAGSLQLSSSTVTGNRASAGTGGGIYIFAENYETLNNTIVAGNFVGGTGTAPNDIAGSINESYYSLVGDAASSGGVVDGAAGNIVGVGIATVLNTSLANNGGPTETHALIAGSPAINAGDPDFTFPPDWDQRSIGYPRVSGGRLDIGAFELQPSTTVCPLPQGYWKNNPDTWPVEDLMLGSQSYTTAELLAILNTPAGTGKNADASLILAYQLIAAKLNEANGANTATVAETIEDADDLLSTYTGKLPYQVRSSSSAGQLMVGYGRTLDAFNKGTTTAGCVP